MLKILSEDVLVGSEDGTREKVCLKTSAGIKIAFARGDVLSPDERFEASYVFHSRMSLRKACRIAAKYGLGKMHEYGASLQQMIQAWIVLGEALWRTIVQTLLRVRDIWHEIYRRPFGLIGDHIALFVRKYAVEQII